MIRNATRQDIPQMLIHGQAMHAESRYRVLPWDGDKVAGLIDWLIDYPDGCVIVAEEDGKIVGGFLGAITPHFCSPATVAQDYGLFVTPDRRGAAIGAELLQAFIAWAKGRDVAMITVGVTTGVNDEGAGRLLQSVGFEQIGQVYEFKE